MHIFVVLKPFRAFLMHLLCLFAQSFCQCYFKNILQLCPASRPDLTPAPAPAPAPTPIFSASATNPAPSPAQCSGLILPTLGEGSPCAQQEDPST